VIVPVYSGRLTVLTVRRDWLSRAVTDVRVLSALNMRSDWCFLVLVTF